MSRRHERLESELTRAVQQVLSRGLNDPRIRGLITVTGVELFDEARRARVLISVLPAERQRATIAGLQAATPHIWREVASLVETRSLPSIEFALDDSLKKQARVLEALAKVREEAEAAGDDGHGEQEARDGER
ncbi:MAG: 30S ribosome-binding factor RbfA [Phycisphaerales bacterium]|nr:30S ribosome-binding factor RbfA [Phycisphaerales bacterium]